MMKMKFQKWIAALISFVMIGIIFSMLPMTSLTASAICCRKDGFDNSKYTLTGNMAEDVATIAKSQKGRTGSQLGYTEAWCDEFVADCIENAGADSSIVGHGGTVADFESVMRKKGADQVSSPQTGDLVFFTYSHVEIVTKVENGTVYCAGGNNGGTGNYKTNYCAGERKLYATPRLYLRPNYSNSEPARPSTTLNVAAGNSSTETTFSWNAVPGATGYDVKIWNGTYWVGDAYHIEWNVQGTSCGIVLPAGYYEAYVDTRIENALMSNVVAFTVKSGTKLEVTAGNSSTETTFSWNAVPGATGYDVKIWNGTYWVGDAYHIEWNVQGTSCGIVLPAGYYEAYVDTRIENALMSNVVAFTVKMKSPTPTITTLSSSSLKLTWKAEPNATSYRIDRRKSGADAYETIATTNQTTYTDTGLEANTKYWYRVYAVAGSDKSSEKNSVSGTTYTLTSPTPTISTISSSSLKLTWTAAANATSYRIDRRKSGADAYETIATTNQTTYTDTGLEANTKYWYRVYAVADYKSSEKNSVSGTTDKINNKCSVTWNDNYNGGSTSETILFIGEKFGIYANSGSNRSGYTFDGWYTEASGGTKITSDTKVPNVARLVLYAHWTPNKYTVHFSANGGSCSKLSAPIQYRNTYGQLPEAQREGYQFLGWYTLKDKGVLVTSDTVFLLTKDQTLYAHWEKINLLGDLSQDNKITLIDLILLQKYLLRQASLTADQSTLADLNEDGIINVIDLILLKRTLLNP